MVFGCWIVWTPTVAIVYQLLLNLQFPIFCLVLCFFVLLISSLEKPNPEQPTT